MVHGLIFYMIDYAGDDGGCAVDDSNYSGT